MTYWFQVEKHWTEKDLKDMTERDWRIFREDFNIAYRGSTDILPMRKWEEGGIPKELLEVSVQHHSIQF
jgi:ATP-dependent RNA helicase DDX23/PRP28